MNNQDTYNTDPKPRVNPGTYIIESTFFSWYMYSDLILISYQMSCTLSYSQLITHNVPYTTNCKLNIAKERHTIVDHANVLYMFVTTPRLTIVSISYELHKTRCSDHFSVFNLLEKNHHIIFTKHTIIM